MRPDKKFKNKVLPLADKLFRLAMSIIGNKQDAEDVVQDTLLRIWQKKDEWDAISNLEGYCLRSARNIALDKVSLKDNQAERIPEYFEFPEYDSVDPIEVKEQAEAIQKIMEHLPEKQRTIFELREVEGLSYKEIEDIMNISEDQVKVSLFRARQKIRSYIEA